MNGESDQPPAALIGTWAEDEDEPEVPPLQLPRKSGSARETRQIPNARSLKGGLDASNGMTFLGLTATNGKLPGARVQSAKSTLLHSAQPFSTRGPRPRSSSPSRGRHTIRRSKGEIMKKILMALLCSCCGLGWAQTAEELLNEGKNTENLTTFGMGYDLKMYSPLKEINKSNVRRLVPIWNFSLTNDMGEHSQPTIYNGVMYVVNGNWTFAIDVATGRQIWRTPVQYERGALRVATSGALMRGPATIYQGKLFRQTV